MIGVPANVRMVVLGTLLNAGSYGTLDMDRVLSTGITKQWFDEPDEGELFDVLHLAHVSGRQYDGTLALDYLKKTKVRDPEGLVLGAMRQAPVPTSVLLGYIDRLKEGYQQRELSTLARSLLSEIEKGDADSEALIVTARGVLEKNVSAQMGGTSKSLSQVRKERLNMPPVERIMTYIPFIDTVLTDREGRKGFRNEGLVFISGLKESGKTFIMTRIVENVSKDMPVLFGSMEFGKELYDENIEQQQKDGFFDGNIDNIYTFDDIYDVDSIVAEIRLQHRLNGIRIAALDSMLRMTNNNPDLKTDEKRLSEMFSKLGRLSKELKIPILVIVQSAKEDLKSSLISVKGSVNADHEAYVWFHITKTRDKDHENELRTVIWNKNKDTKKHPKQHLMFVPQTSDFYRVELDKDGGIVKALDHYRAPSKAPVEIVYEDVPAEEAVSMPNIF